MKNNNNKVINTTHRTDGKKLSNPWVELRLVAFGSDSVGLVEYKDRSDPVLLRMYKLIGFIGASNTTTNEMFVFKYQPPKEGQSIRDSLFVLLHCIGETERIVENGTISHMEESGERSEYNTFNVSGRVSGNWVFMCDKNPRLACRLGWVSMIYPYGFIQQSSVCVGRTTATGDHLLFQTKPVALTPKHNGQMSDKNSLLALAIERSKTDPPRVKIVVSLKVDPIIPPRENNSHIDDKVTPPEIKVVSTIQKRRGRKSKSKVELPSLVSKNRQMDGVEMRVPVSEVIPFQPNHDSPEFTGQPRVNFDPIELRELAASIAENGQTTPIPAIRVSNIPGKNYELTDGERRWRAIQMVEGLDTVRILLETHETKKDQHLASLIHNFNRVGHTPLEFSNALQLQINAGETIQRLAILLGMKEHSIRKFLWLQRLHPELRPLLDPPTPKNDRIRINEGVELGRLALDRQVEIWNNAKVEKSRRLVMLKIRQEGKDFVVNKRTKSDSVNRPRKIQNKLTIMHGLVTELSSLTVNDWKRYIELSGSVGDTGVAIPESKQLADFTQQIEATRQKMSKALFETRKSSSLVSNQLELETTVVPK